MYIEKVVIKKGPTQEKWPVYFIKYITIFVSLGYAHLAFCEVLLQVYGEDSEILECFDLFAGTSVGGVAAIIMNQMDTL